MGVQAVPQDLDLSSLASVHEFVAHAAENLPPLDVVIANAGVGFVPGKVKTKEGHDLAFGVNHLGHFALLQVTPVATTSWLCPIPDTLEPV